MLSRQEVNTMRHLANAQYWDRPAGGNTGRLFLAFGGPVCADRISNCPLDRVLTYKNLIYLLNLQFYCVNTTYLVDRCICPALCRSRQTLEKNVLSWALAGTGSVLFTRQVAVQPTCRYTAHACACALPLFVWRVRT